MRLPTHKTKYHTVTCKGGPWDKLEVLAPVQDKGDPLSLPIKVGEHRGRYNLDNGKWVPHE